MTTIAVPDTRPAIVCPDWCTITYESHHEDLRLWDGYVIHWSDLGQRVYLGIGAFPDGTPAPDDPPLIHLDNYIGELSIDAAEDVACQILALVAVVRA